MKEKDILGEIIARKRLEVEKKKELQPLLQLEKKLVARKSAPIYPMKEALARSSSGIIAEFKRKSPSKGWLFREAKVKEVVPAYADGGATALSVLTDEPYFGGTLEDLQQAATAVRIPVMRKEFIIDAYQLFEARLAGASAVLLIAAAITPEECRQFTMLSLRLGMEVLLELHDESEIAYVDPQNTLIGVNNRNLGSFVTDVQKSFRMAELLPKEAVKVSESGISDPVVVKELRDAGFHGFLIGEHFMKSEDPGAALRDFILKVQE